MAVPRKVAETYLKSFLECLRNGDDSLTSHEKRIGKKYLEAMQKAESAAADAKKLQSQITQAEASIRSLQLVNQDNIGRAEAFLDTIVDLHFDDDVASVEVAEEKTPDEKTTPKKKTSKAAAKTAAATA